MLRYSHMESKNTPDYSGSTEVRSVTKSNLLMICDPLCRVTTFSKILASVLFIMLPFIGAWVGYRVAGENAARFSVADIDVLAPAARVITESPDQAVQTIDYRYIQLADGQSYISEENGLIGYKRIKDSIYLIEANGNEKILNEVKNVQFNNFQVSKSKSVFAHDGVTAYVEGQVIPGVDIETFLPLIGLPTGLEVEIAVSKDKNAVYIYTKKLDRADAKSFVALGKFGFRMFGHMGIDKNNIYEFGRDYQNVKPLILDTGERIKISETENISLEFDQRAGAKPIVYPEAYNGWYDLRFGLSVEGVGYINRGYIVDGQNTYSMFDTCSGMSENRVCNFTITKVEQVGEIPTSVLTKANTFGVKQSF